MRVLGIESSCDETGVALYDTERGLMANTLHSQIALHSDYGGVVPELASRDHIRRMIPLLRQTLAESHSTLEAVDAIAYTQGPGLAGALLVGSAFAHGLAIALQKPVLPIHHLEGHLLSPLLSPNPPDFPFVALLVSGGHTQLMRVTGAGRYVLMGETLDDAAGEAFDKTAKLLGLGYPGGPALSALAEQGHSGSFDLPRPMRASGDFNFSFAGLKTAVLTLIRNKSEARPDFRADVARAFQDALIDVLVEKSIAALKRSGLTRLVVAGGVGANRALRRNLDAAAARHDYRVYYPPQDLCTDNGAMIAFAGAMRLSVGASARPAGCFAVRPRWPLQEINELSRS